MKTVSELWDDFARATASATRYDAADATAAFFAGIETDAQELVAARPNEFRNRPGVPFALRCPANKAQMVADRDRLTTTRQAGRLNREDKEWLDFLEYACEGERSFPYYAGKKGVAEIHGRWPGEASKIYIPIPGMNLTLNRFHELAEFAAKMRRLFVHIDGCEPDEISQISFGYQVPRGLLQAIDPKYASDAAPALVDLHYSIDLEAVRAGRRPSIAWDTNSYGMLVASKALQQLRVENRSWPRAVVARESSGCGNDATGSPIRTVDQLSRRGPDDELLTRIAEVFVDGSPIRAIAGHGGPLTDSIKLHAGDHHAHRGITRGMNLALWNSACVIADSWEHVISDVAYADERTVRLSLGGYGPAIGERVVGAVVGPALAALRLSVFVRDRTQIWRPESSPARHSRLRV